MFRNLIGGRHEIFAGDIFKNEVVLKRAEGLSKVKESDYVWMRDPGKYGEFVEEVPPYIGPALKYLDCPTLSVEKAFGEEYTGAKTLPKGPNYSIEWQTWIALHAPLNLLSD